MTTITYDIDFNNGAVVVTDPSAIVSQYNAINIQARLINFVNIVNVRATVTLPNGDTSTVYLVKNYNYDNTYFISITELFDGLTIDNLQQCTVKFIIVTDEATFTTPNSYFTLYNTSDRAYYAPSDLTALFMAYNNMSKQIAEINRRLNILEGN
jgi:hypothetical protein